MKSLREIIADKERAPLNPELEKLRRLVPALEKSLGYKEGSLKADLITDKRVVFATNNHAIAQDFYLKITEVRSILEENFEGQRKITIIVKP